MSQNTEVSRLNRQASIYRYVGIAMLVVAIVMAIAHVTNVLFYLPVVLIALICIVLGVMTRSKLQNAKR